MRRGLGPDPRCREFDVTPKKGRVPLERPPFEQGSCLQFPRAPGRLGASPFLQPISQADQRFPGLDPPPGRRRAMVELLNGCVLMCPVDLLQGLRGAPDAALADVELMPRGLDLHWKKLDVQFTIAGLLRGVFGTKAWLAELGRVGGRVASPAKRAAARANGRLGGRPRKTA